MQTAEKEEKNKETTREINNSKAKNRLQVFKG